MTDLGAFNGVLGGPFARLYGPRSNGFLIDQQLELEGSVAAYEASGCSGVTVRDLGGADPPRCFSGVLRAPRLAGRFLAVIAGSLPTPSPDDRIVVFDHLTGEEVYRVENLPSGEPVPVLAIDVQADGTTAFAYRSGEGGRGRSRLGWASPASPTAHTLPTPARSDYQLRLAAGRVAYIGSDGSAVPPTAELGVVDLTGRSRVLTRGVYGDLFNDTLDFDGTRITWVGPTCAGPRIYVGEVDTLTTTRTRRRCPLKLRMPPRVDRRGRVSLSLDCTGLTSPCLAYQVVVRTARRYRYRGRTIPAGRLLAIRNDPRRSMVRVRLSRLGKRLLTTRGRLRVRLSAELGDDSLGRETRKTTRTLTRLR